MYNNNDSLNERELLTDLLHTEKSMLKTYADNCTEVSGPELRQLLIRHMTECSQDQLAVFDQMHMRNLYPTKIAPGQEVASAKQNMQQLKSETW